MIEETEGNVPTEVTRVPKRRRGVGLGAELDGACGSVSASTLGALFSLGREGEREVLPLVRGRLG